MESTANKKRTCIVQKYIHNPLLINKRKFDIRLYAVLSSVNANLKGYFYQDGYLRTSSKEFTLQNLSNRMIHLTNDAVQKKAEDYGKYESGNKLSYSDFQNYLDKNFAELSICFERDLLPQMKVNIILTHLRLEISDRHVQSSLRKNRSKATCEHFRGTFIWKKVCRYTVSTSCSMTSSRFT